MAAKNENKGAGKDRDMDFASLRGPGRRDEKKKDEVHDVEETTDEGFTVISNKKSAATKKAPVMETKDAPEAIIKIKKSGFAAIEENSSDEEDSKTKEESKTEETKSEDDEASDAEETATTTAEEKKKEDKKPATAKSAYVPPAQKKKMEEDERRRKEEEERKRIREEKLAEQRAEKAIEDAKQAEVDKIKYELESQKRAREERGMEDAVSMKEAAAKLKKQKAEEEKRRKELQKARLTRFTKNHCPELMLKFDADLKGAWPKVGEMDLKKYFETEEVMEKNKYHAALLFVKRILFQSGTEDELQYFVESNTKALSQLLSSAKLEGVELLYAATHVANEMRNEKRQLPDYNKETSVIEAFFWELYSAKLVSEEECLQWFDDLEDETPGRMDVIFQVTPFMHFLRPPVIVDLEQEADEEEAENEEDEDEEDDEE